MAVSRAPAKTDAERRERYLAKHRRYERSEKGKARFKAYRDSVAKAKGELQHEGDPFARLAEMVED